MDKKLASLIVKKKLTKTKFMICNFTLYEKSKVSHQRIFFHETLTQKIH